MKIHTITTPATPGKVGQKTPPARSPSVSRKWFRYGVAALLIVLALLTACLVQVQSGNATVITRFGSPVRVLLEPGLAWRLPAPFESPVDVNLRTRSTSSGLQDVGTRDGLRVIVQAWAIWKVNPEPEHVLRFIRAVQNQPEEAARQIRTFIGSSLETTTSNYALSDIVNTDGKKIKISQLEKQIENQLKTQLLNSYGIELVQVGIERLTLPSVTLNATVERMRAERETIATERTAEGNRLAAEIHSKADRDARIMEADASVKASAITAQAQRDVAAIYAKAYALDPQLYNLLRSLDTLNDVVNKSTRIVLSTDADPFKALVQQPSETDRPSQ
ncbi:protease modulator HflC [Enterobacter hormaechei]|nr:MULTISPECIES: protease modulator HflC [Enterobacteriaceae]MCM7403087.1 protease modulator HflC [Enterobacter hormaechei]EFT1104477.1 protease modulator HflC [Salmonella enterica]EFT2080380.1 protease modulator HflC [Salmonella enterica]EFT5089034.1 protease modulator HflC [Salmonella enterica]EFT5152585.1 protease modulator HflC [Salmonella enterica]